MQHVLMSIYYVLGAVQKAETQRNGTWLLLSKCSQSREEIRHSQLTAGQLRSAMMGPSWWAQISSDSDSFMEEETFDQGFNDELDFKGGEGRTFQPEAVPRVSWQQESQ